MNVRILSWPAAFALSLSCLSYGVADAAKNAQIKVEECRANCRASFNKCITDNKVSDDACGTKFEICVQDICGVTDGSPE